MAIIESVTTAAIILGLFTASGNIGTENRRKPYVPIVSRTPASITEPAVGASVCASGNQVWNGNIGTLMANAKNSPQKSHCCSVVPNDGATASSTSILNVYAS